MLCLDGAGPADVNQRPSVRALESPDDDHQIDRPGQLLGVDLSLPDVRADRVFVGDGFVELIRVYLGTVP